MTPAAYAAVDHEKRSAEWPGSAAKDRHRNGFVVDPTAAAP